MIGRRDTIVARDLPSEVQKTAANPFVSDIYIPDEGVNFNTEGTAAAVPEPASFALAGLALAGLTFRSRQRVTTGDSSRRGGRA